MAERKNGAKGAGKGKNNKGSDSPKGSSSKGGSNASNTPPTETTSPAPPAWTSKHLWQIQPVRDVLLFAAIFGVIVLGYKISIVTVPLLLGLTFAYLFEPIVVKLTRGGRISRQGAATGIVAAFVVVVGVPVTIGVGFGIVQTIAAAQSLKANAVNVDTVMDYAKAFRETEGAAWEIDDETGLIDFTPDGVAVTVEDGDRPITITQYEAEMAYRDLGETYKWWCRYDLTRRLGMNEGGKNALPEGGGGDAGTKTATGREPLLFTAVDLAVRYMERNTETITDKAVGQGMGAASAALRTVTSLGMILFMGFLTAFFFFFISSSFGRVMAFLRTLLPSSQKEQYLDLLGQMDAVIAGFIRGRITIAFIQSFVFTLGYALIGVPMALVLGPLVAILSIVPYLALIGVPVSIVLMFLNVDGGGGEMGFQSHWAWIVFAPTVFYFVGQSLDDYVWTPRIQGKATGMDTPTILFASIAGGALMGVYGLLLAIPAAACIKILLREIFWPRFKAWSEGKEKDFLPLGR